MEARDEDASCSRFLVEGEVTKVRQTNRGLHFVTVRNAKVVATSSSSPSSGPLSAPSSPRQRELKKCQISVWNLHQTGSGSADEDGRQEQTASGAPAARSSASTRSLEKSCGLDLLLRFKTRDSSLLYVYASDCVPDAYAAGGAAGSCFLVERPERQVRICRSGLSTRGQDESAAREQDPCQQVAGRSTSRMSPVLPVAEFCGFCSAVAEAERQGCREGAEVCPRFHFVPDNVRWGSSLRRFHVQAYNVLRKLPSPSMPVNQLVPSCGRCESSRPKPDESGRPMLLPSTDAAAVWIAENAEELGNCGWSLPCYPSTALSPTAKICEKPQKSIHRILADKALFLDHAELVLTPEELKRSFPKRYHRSENTVKEEAAATTTTTFPIIYKPSTGQYGRGARLLWTKAALDDVLQLEEGRGNIGKERYVLQEYVFGACERSTSVLVWQGRVLDGVTCEYTYAATDAHAQDQEQQQQSGRAGPKGHDERPYIWPLQVRETAPRRFFPYEDPSTSTSPSSRTTSSNSSIPAGPDVAIFEKLLTEDFSGICNFNYKMVDEEMRIFECNPRPGGDLIQDCPREHAIRILEKYEQLCSAPGSASSDFD